MATETKSTKTKIHTVYKNLKGERLPSVTTVLGVLNKPALMDWAWKCGCDGLDYKAVRDTAGGIGTLAHYLILCHLKHETPDTSEYSAQDIDKAETCLIKFWEWDKQYNICPILVETPLVSEPFGFGGTIDCLCQITQGPSIYKNMLLDFKTGKGIYPEMFYQLAAYSHLLAEHNMHHEGAMILRIGRDENEGFEVREMGNLDRHFEVFKHCLGIYQLQKELR